MPQTYASASRPATANEVRAFGVRWNCWSGPCNSVRPVITFNHIRQHTMTSITALLLAPALGLADDAVQTVPTQALNDNPDNPIEITEWAVPWEESRPRDPYVDAANNRVWFVGQRDHYLAYMDLETEEFERFDLEDGDGPHNLLVADDGRVWYAGNRAMHIGVLNPETGDITRYDVPEEARDPHTMDFGLDNTIWFTAQGGNAVGRFHMETGEVEVVPMPGEGVRPYGLVVDDEGRPWFNELGTNIVATIDPDNLELREYELPREDARTRRIGLTSDGMVWWVDWAEGYVGRLNPETEEVDEWATPGGSDAGPYGMAVDSRDRIWFVESGMDPNRFVGFDPASEEFFSSTEIESGGGTVRHMVFHEPTGEIWFGTDTNNLARARVP